MNELSQLQYGRIVDIELKVPPRPPCYCFVEVRFLHVLNQFYKILLQLTKALCWMFCSLSMLGMLKMRSMAVMGTTLTAVV